MWPNDNLNIHQWKTWFFEMQTWYFEKKIFILLNAILITWNENLITFETKSSLEYKSALKFICISVLNRPFHEFNKLGKICRQHWKERIKISKIVSSAKSLNFTDVCIVGGRGAHTNVCKISRLCGAPISSLVFNKSLSNLAISLILIEKTVKGSVDCNFRIATGRKTTGNNQCKINRPNQIGRMKQAQNS